MNLMDTVKPITDLYLYFYNIYIQILFISKNFGTLVLYQNSRLSSPDKETTTLNRSSSFWQGQRWFCYLIYLYYFFHLDLLLIHAFIYQNGCLLENTLIFYVKSPSVAANSSLGDMNIWHASVGKNEVFKMLNVVTYHFVIQAFLFPNEIRSSIAS